MLAEVSNTPWDQRHCYLVDAKPRPNLLTKCLCFTFMTSIYVISRHVAALSDGLKLLH